MGRVSKILKNKEGLLSLLLALLFFGIVIFMFIPHANSGKQSYSRLQRIEFQGVCQTGENGEEMLINSETLKELGACKHLILKGNFNEVIPKGERIFIYLRRINVKIYQNGKLICSYGRENLTAPVLKSGGNVWIEFDSRGITPEDEIKIEVDNPYRANTKQVYSLLLHRIFVGDQMQLFQRMLRRHYFTTPVCIVIFLMGVTLTIVAGTMRVMNIQSMQAFMHFGMMMSVCGLWMMIDFCYISLLFPAAIVWDVFETLLFINIPALGFLYLSDFMVTKAKWFIKAWQYGLMAFNFIYLLLQGLGVMDGEMTQEGIRFLQPLMAVIALGCVLYEMRENRDETAAIVFLSGTVFILFSIYGVIRYFFSGKYSADVFGVGFCMFVIVQYGVILRKAKESYRRGQQAKRMEKELTENRIAMMLSQIQPHFLYNSLTCIQDLCLNDPKKAYDALAQFSHFLRGNMDSLSSNRPIAFTKELRHVRNYLALEQLRFEERLSVSYQLEIQDFLIPVLTLQPIVENAVRYGISKKEGGGTVSIETREEENYIVITVSDDGVGFDVNQALGREDSRSHIGISNVRERLVSQCNGRLEISSTPGKGTEVLMFIPKL